MPEHELRPTNSTDRPPRDFVTVWGGQTLSLIGTEITAVAVSFVAFLQTGSLTWLATLYLAIRVPALLVASHAGGLVDRWSARRVLLGADVLAGVASTTALALHVAGSLRLWHLVVLSAMGSLANAYQMTAYQAAVPRLVPTAALPRAHGLLQLTQAAGLLVAPATAGLLVGTGGIGLVLVLDVLTFVVAVTATSSADFGSAQVAHSPGGDVADGPADRHDEGGVRATWRHLREHHRPGLRRLVVWGALVNVALTTLNLMLPALLLSTVSETTAGFTLTAGGVAMLVASLAVSARGLPDRLVTTLVGATAVVGLGVLLVGLRPHIGLTGVGVVVALAAAPVVGAAANTLHQREIELDWQGRMAALRRIAAEVLVLPTVVVLSPVVERVVAPSMSDDGWLSELTGWALGTGAGREYGLMIVLAGVAVVAIAVAMSRDDELGELNAPSRTDEAVHASAAR